MVLLPRCPRSATYIGLLIAAAVVVGCEDDRGPAAPAAKDSAGTRTTAPTVVTPAVANRDEEDAREVSDLQATLKKGGQFWSSRDNWQSDLPKTPLATSEGVILIRPVQDAVVKIVNTGKSTRNPNVAVAVTALRVPGKEVPAMAGKLVLGTYVELQWTGKVVARRSQTTLNPMLREQKAVLNWWPETDEEPSQKATAFLYLTYSNQPARAISNILQLQVEFVD